MLWMPFVFLLSARLPADLEIKPVHKGLDRLRGARMFFGVAEYHRQHKGPRMLLDRHPLVGEHHTGAAADMHYVMIVIHQLLCLLTSANRDCLVRMDLIE